MSTRTIHFVSLGCPKNRVDSEVMLGVASQAGFSHVDDASAAEVIVVNTCGFIEDAKKESIDTILEMARHKETGACERLVVAGCLSQRHPDELAEGMPEVDQFLGSSDMMRLGDVLRAHTSRSHLQRVLVGTPADWLIGAETPRRLSTTPGSAYVKIAEGCNRTCSFCVIPELRGKQRSRTIEDVAREVEALAASGVKEVNLVSQDTIAYGRDLDGAGGKPTLAALARRLGDIDGIRWVRLFYLYPETLTDELVDVLANHPRVVPYVDMPLQHAADGMLRRMRRGHGGARLRQVVDRLRTSIPNLTFRTAFIVGHPGETDEEFDELCEFVRWAEFDRVGVFRYSDEESARSFTIEGKVPSALAARRHKKLMTLQRKISAKRARALVGREVDVLVEGPSDEHELVMMGRHAGQAPDIDGQVYLSDEGRVLGEGLSGEGEAPLAPGQMVRVTLTESSDYDLVGEVMGAGAGTGTRTRTGKKQDAAAPQPSKQGRVRLRVLPTDGRSNQLG